MIAILAVSENFNEILKSSKDERLTRSELETLEAQAAIERDLLAFVPEFEDPQNITPIGWVMISLKDLKKRYNYTHPKNPDRWFEITRK